MTILKTKTINVTGTTTRELSMWINESGKHCIGYIHPSGTRVVYDSGTKTRIGQMWKRY